MKNLLIIALACCISAAAFAQKKKSEKSVDKSPVTEKPSATPETKPAQAAVDSVTRRQQQQEMSGFFIHFQNKYLLANQLGDYDVAKDALYDILVEYPAADSLWMMLADLYYNNQKFTSAALVGQVLLAHNPRDPNVLDLTGSAFESLGLKDRALQYFESLYLVTNDFLPLYKMALLQYDVRRLKESQANCDIMLTKKEADELKVTLSTADQKSKDYPIRVSVLNLQGMIARDNGDKASAKKYFEQALAVAPDFVQARENLAALAKMK